jgi:hypothetical protein
LTAKACTIGYYAHWAAEPIPLGRRAARKGGSGERCWRAYKISSGRTEASGGWLDLGGGGGGSAARSRTSAGRGVRHTFQTPANKANRVRSWILEGHLLPEPCAHVHRDSPKAPVGFVNRVSQREECHCDCPAVRQGNGIPRANTSGPGAMPSPRSDSNWSRPANTSARRMLRANGLWLAPPTGTRMNFEGQVGRRTTEYF